MSILFIGTIISKEHEKRLKRMGISPNPSGVVQRYYLDGLRMIHNEEISVISSARVKSYVTNKILKVNDENYCNGDIQIHSKGFLNLPLIGFAQREIRVVSACTLWAKKHKNYKNYVYVYSVHSPFLKAAHEIKKIAPNTEIILIVPDLPMYMMGGNGKLRHLLKLLDGRRINALLKEVDKYLLYTRQMAEALSLSDDKWIVVEGLIDTKKIKKNNNENKYICMYAGSLLEQYGIRKMIKAFSKLSNEYKLYLYGNPTEIENYLDDINKSDNVVYKGLITPDEAFEAMREATLLLNPRPSDLELTKYSCPSKTFEYMASGTPVLMCRLPGLPREYFDYIYFFDDESEKGFLKKMEDILSKDYKELREKGRNAQTFLLREKSIEERFRLISKFVISK